MARIMILFFLLASLRLTSCQTVTSLQPETAVKVVPENMDLTSFIFLNCLLEPRSLTMSEFDSRWTLPSGEIFTFSLPNPPGFEQFRVSQGPVATEGGLGIATLLFISNITYQDAGNYTCEVRGLSAPPQSPWLLATTELQLEVNLQANGSSVTARSNDSDVELRCEMTLYIRADEDLQWFSGSMMITSGTSRHTVSYRNGAADTAQNGGNALVPGRVSVLTISSPQQSDSGTYSCRLLGTEQSADIQLNVIPIEQGNPEASGTTHSTIVSPSVALLGQEVTLSTRPPAQTDLQTIESVSANTASAELQAQPTPTITPSDGSQVGSRPGTQLTPTITPSDDSQVGSRPGTPIALILGCAIVGALALIVLVVVTITIACFVGRRKKSKPHSEDRSTSRVRTNQYEHSKPLYAEVFKPPLPPIPERTTDSPVSNSNKEDQLPEPREILAYDIDIPGTFRPFAPPPPVAGMSNGGANTITQNGGANIYDIPEAMYVDDSVAPDWLYYNRGNSATEDGDSYYDQVETVHDDYRGLTSSLQPFTPSVKSSKDRFSGSHTLPARFRSPGKPNGRESPDYDYVYNETLEPSMLQNSVSFDGSERGLPYAPIYDSPKPLKKSEELLHISRQKIVEIRNLGVGHFGKVVLGATVGISLKDLGLGENDDRNRSLLVAIKKLKEDADSLLRESFDKEIKFMTRLKHANVVRLLGVCMGAESFLMMEYMENGDLHEFLHKQKLVPDVVSVLQDGDVTPLILLYMSVQVASGMRYLASRNFVHRDLAARNCLVGRDFVVKISDFGMSRKLYDSVYYRVQGHLILPIRWMAYESFYGKFSVKSDVWSFGVTIWEIFTLAENEPYHEMSDEELIANAIKEEGRKLLSHPSTCPKEVYDIMRRCWVHDPILRADFDEVYSRLFVAYTKLSKQFDRTSSAPNQSAS